jgi:S1-C subfamily serine protease
MILNVKIGKSPKDLDKLEEAASTTDAREEMVFRGMQVADISASSQRRLKEYANSGVVVIRIDPDSPTDRSGLMVGDVITKLGDKLVTDKESFKVAASKVKGSWLIKATRGFFVVKEK